MVPLLRNACTAAESLALAAATNQSTSMCHVDGLSYAWCDGGDDDDADDSEGDAAAAVEETTSTKPMAKTIANETKLTKEEKK